jgi:hypothetical protein
VNERVTVQQTHPTSGSEKGAEWNAILFFKKKHASQTDHGAKQRGQNNGRNQ